MREVVGKSRSITMDVDLDEETLDQYAACLAHILPLSTLFLLTLSLLTPNRAILPDRKSFIFFSFDYTLQPSYSAGA